MLHDPIHHPDLKIKTAAGQGGPVRLSVILPVYNRAHSIAEALQSVLDQTHPADEIIVVDDGSSDDLETALAPYRADIRLIRQPNAGVAAARNTGAAAARGGWLAFQDSDDLWSRDHLATVMRDLTGAPADTVAHLGDVTYTGAGYTEALFAIKNRTFPQDHAARLEDPLPLVISGMTLQGAAIRRDVFARLGGFDTAMRMLSDTAFFCQLALEGPFAVTGRTLAEIRRLPGDDSALTSLHRKNAVYARQMHVRGLAALAARPLSPAHRVLADKRLSGAEFRLAQALHSRDPKAARALLWQAARRHPSPLKGWIKSQMAAIMGPPGYRWALSDSSLDRS